MGKALYRKYRSKSLDEIVGQSHITDTLKNAIASGRVSHAYLLTGPRGVGKTSIARILAHAINDIDYTDDSAHLDIIEIDAASNRRIDEIRDLRDKVYIAPTSAKYKVYIIDEVHMLTKEAFNALLKTLEEPPEHVIFILATTDVHKVPETIVSRTQKFTFRPVPTDEVAAHLRYIAQSENIDITDEALTLIAEHGQGSFRDSISLLDQANGIGSKVDAQSVSHMLGIPEAALISTLLGFIVEHNVSEAIKSVQAMLRQGYPAVSIASSLSTQLRAKIVQNEPLTKELLALMHDLIRVPESHQPDRYLEIAIITASTNATMQSLNNAPAEPKERATSNKLETTQHPSPEIVEKPTKVEQKPSIDTEQTEVKAVEVTKKAKASVAPAKKPNPADNAQLDNATWAAILSALKAQYNTLYGVIRMAQPSLQGKELILSFAFAFHQKRVTETKNMHKLAEIVASILGDDITIHCVVNKDTNVPTMPVAAKTPKPKESPDISSISNIFGGAELIES